MFREYQESAIRSIFDFFRLGGKAGLISAPTGSGKSFIIAGIIQRALEVRPNFRVVSLAHRQELLSQNGSKLLKVLPECSDKLSFYSEGLGSKRIDQICFAGIQSCWSKFDLFGKVNLLIIDEAHMIPKKGEGQYRTFIEGLKLVNPKLYVVGLTATPFRTDSGFLTNGANPLFEDICYEIPVGDLIEAGYLSKLITKQAKNQIDTSEVRVRQGDYVLKELEDALDPLVGAAVNEMIECAHNRKKWLVFCPGIKSAEVVSEEISSRGVKSAVITGKTPSKERASILAAFHRGDITALCNCDVLTTGYDEPGIDMIAILRPTKSGGLYVQIAGRGLRISPEKKNCLILDFGMNIDRFGPIDCMRFRRKSDKIVFNPRPYKICPQCGVSLNMGVQFCTECDYEFEKVAALHEPEASEDPIISEPKTLTVYSVSYRRHKKTDKPDSMRVDYHCGTTSVSEFICFEHGGIATMKALKWYADRCPEPLEKVPTVAEALLAQGRFKVPKKITVKQDGKFWRVIEVDYLGLEEEPPEDFVESELVEGMNI